MKQKVKQWIAYMLSFCMVFGMTQIMSVGAVFAADVADGEIDTSQEGVQIVRYLTGTETASSTDSTKYYLASYTDRLEDFFAGTESMTWSVQFKTERTGLQALLSLESNGNYCNLYLKDNKLSFEPNRNSVAATTGNLTYADNEYHTAELEIQKGEAVILRMDGEEVARNASPTLLKDLSWTPTAFTIGGSKDYSSASGWKFQGSMKNVVLKKTVLAEASAVWSASNLQDAPVETGLASDLAAGSLTMSYRLKEAEEARQTLMTFGADGELYADPANGKIGVSIGGSTVEKEAGAALGITKWHNVALVKSDAQIELYVDGSSVGSGAYEDGLDLSEIQKGGDVYCSGAFIYDRALNAEQVADLHDNTNLTAYPDPTPKLEGYYKGENREIFNAGFDGSVAYRIPAITTSKKTGTVVAAIDKRWTTSADTGINDTVIRRSEDNGKTWGPVIPVIDMPDADAYTIDPEIVTDNDPNSPHYGRIYILVDLNRNGTSLWGAVDGTGYTNIDGKDYQILEDKEGNAYTIREGGIVYDSEGNPTEYRVETEAEAPYKMQGALYKDGTHIGSIYKNAELTMIDTVYLWMTYSDDDGKTWARPKDLTPMVKADWMSFFGVGPGAGVQLRNGEHKGRLVFTMYCIKHGMNSSGFSSYNVYSDDHGETWHRGGSPNPDPSTSTRELNESCIVELDNGHLIQFMKNSTANVATAVSQDGGATWSEVSYQEGIREVYCEMAVLHYGDLYDPADGQTKEAIIFANPGGPGRTHGTVRIAFVNADDTLDWAYDKLIEEHNFLYNSLTLMNDGNIGMIYENEKGSSTAAAFTSFSPQYIMDPNVYENTPQPTGIEVAMKDASGNETSTVWKNNRLEIKISFDYPVFASGNVTSNVMVGDQVKEAELIGSDGPNTLVFGYTVQEKDTDEIVAAAEVNVKEGGVAETVYNVPLTDKPFVMKTLLLGRMQAAGMVFAQLPQNQMEATTPSQHSEGPVGNALDGDESTYWHSLYDDHKTDLYPETRKFHYIDLKLDKNNGSTYLVSGLEYLPRQNENGRITKYQIEVSADGSTYYPYEVGYWANNNDWKKVSFRYGPVPAAYVRLRSLESTRSVTCAAEIRIIGSGNTEGAVNRIALVQELLKYDNIKEGIENSYPSFAAALAEAEEKAADVSATQEQIDGALTALTEAVASSLQGLDEDLEAALAEAEGKDSSIYTLSSWIAYQAAVEAAQSLAGNASQEEKLDAYAVLKDAEANLKLTDTEEAKAAEETEAKAEAVMEELDKIVEDGNGFIGDGNKLPAETEDGAPVIWNADSEYVTIDADGNITVAKGLKEEREVVFTTTIFYDKGKSIVKSISIKVSPNLEQYTVTFDSMGGTNVEAATVDEDTAVGKPQNPSKTGYTFAGWYSDKTCAKEYDFTAKVTGDIKLYAKWTAKTFQITFAANGAGASGMPGAVTKKYNETFNVSAVKAPTRAGYSFLGWSRTASGQTIKSLAVTENVTLYAQWQEQKESPKLTKDKTETVGTMMYKVLDPDKKTVAVAGSKNKKATSLKIGDTVTINGVSCSIVQIGNGAFKNYKKLKQVTIGKNVVTIEKNAFSGCGKLGTITLKGNALKQVRSNAFKKTAKKLTVKASKVKKPQKKKLQTIMRRGGNKKLIVK